MTVTLYSNEEESLLVLKDEATRASQVFHLDETVQHGVRFYCQFHEFQAGLKEDLSLSEQPYGKIGASCDLTGRIIGPNLGQRLISTQGDKILTLEQPIYSEKGDFSDSELKEILEGYVVEQHDIPYAALIVSASGISDFGDDLYQNALFFMTGGYGILAETSVIAGRDVDDCCSPEYHYVAHKVDLDDVDSVIKALEPKPETSATLTQLRVSASPEILPNFTMESDDWSSETGKLEELLRSLLL